MTNIDNKVVFYLGQGKNGPALIIGIPKKAYEGMKDATQTLDLNKIGMPLQVILYAEETHADCKKLIENYAKSIGTSILDLRREDFSV
jgi:hypothetical protein